MPVAPVETSLLEILSPIDGDWNNVLTYVASDPVDHWHMYDVAQASAGFSQELLNIDCTMGLWIHMTENTTLTIHGTPLVDINIQLYTGWNMVGYPVQNENNYTVAELKMETGANIVEGFNSSAEYKVSELPDSYVLQKGEAYWVYVPADIIWMP